MIVGRLIEFERIGSRSEHEHLGQRCNRTAAQGQSGQSWNFPAFFGSHHQNGKQNQKDPAAVGVDQRKVKDFPCFMRQGVIVKPAGDGDIEQGCHRYQQQGNPGQPQQR